MAAPNSSPMARDYEFDDLRCYGTAVFNGLMIVGRFSQSQIGALSGKIPYGSIAYNTTTSSLIFWNGNSWTSIDSSGGSGYTPPTIKGVLVTSDGDTARNLTAGYDGSVLTADSSADVGLSYKQVDHNNLLNKGTNTHNQIDSFIASKGQPGGIAVLDGSGQIPSSQLGNAPGGAALPSAKGALPVGDGTTSAMLTAGIDGTSPVADSAQTTGIKWDNVDHTTLKNRGTNTHAQIDTFIASKGQGSGLATLDATGKLPLTQTPSGIDHTTLSNVGTNTHSQIDTFMSTKGQPSGLATLDTNGQVPSSQLGNVPPSASLPTTKGAIPVGNGTTSATLAVGVDNTSPVADTTQATGIRWDNIDHTTLKNRGTNTHAQIDTFIASKGQANGIASLDGSGQIPSSQLGNAPATSLPTTKGSFPVGNGTSSTAFAVGSNGQTIYADSSQTNGLAWRNAGGVYSGSNMVAQRVPIPQFTSASTGTKTIFTYDVSKVSGYDCCFLFQYTVVYHVDINYIGAVKGHSAVIASSTTTGNTIQEFGKANEWTVDSGSLGATFATSISGNNWIITVTVPSAVGWDFTGFVDVAIVEA